MGAPGCGRRRTGLSIDGREGPDHDPLFTVSVKVGAFAPATGSGAPSASGTGAASALLLREGVWNAA